MLYLALVLRDMGLRLETAPLLLSKDPRKVWQRMLDISPREKGFGVPDSGVYLYRLYPDQDVPLEKLFTEPGRDTFHLPGLICSLRSEGGEWRATWFDPVAQRQLTSSAKRKKDA